MYLSTTLQYTYSASSYWVYLARVWPTTPALPWEDIQPGCIDPVSKDTVPTHADLHTNLNTHWGQILWGFFILDATFSLSPSRSSIASDCLKADSASSNFVPANRDCPWWNSSGKKFRLHPTTCSSNLPLSMVCLGDTSMSKTCWGHRQLSDRNLYRRHCIYISLHHNVHSTVLSCKRTATVWLFFLLQIKQDPNSTVYAKR